MNTLRRGLTLIELMITLAVVAVLVTLAAPSFYDFILTQRLKAAAQQFVTDMQLARSEASARNEVVRVYFARNSTMSCYSIFVANSDTTCVCTAANACPVSTGVREIRTNRLPTGERVGAWPVGLAPAAVAAFRFDPLNGAMVTDAVDLTGSPLQAFAVDFSLIPKPAAVLRTVIARSGRPSLCAPAGSTMPGLAC